MLPVTPTATSMTSASTVCFPSGVSISALMPVGVFSTLPVFDLVRIVTPRRVEALRQFLRDVFILDRRITSIISTMVTLVPIAL